MPYATPATSPVMAPPPVVVKASPPAPYHPVRFSTPLNAPHLRTVIQPPTPQNTPPKRVRGQRTTNFTTSGTSSSSSTSDADSDTVQEVSSFKSKRRLKHDISTVGRKEGVAMRNAAGLDVPLASASRSSSTGSIASTSTAATTPAKDPIELPSPASIPPPAQPPVPAPKKYQAVVAGQGNILKLNMEAIKRARSASPAITPATAMASASPSATTDGKPKYNTVGPTSAPFIRKKSGELVKPALRTSRTYSSPCLEEQLPSPVALTPTTPASAVMLRRNSAPTTPTPRSVRFDAQLEHVKLFLAEQKPAAVSRTGSPNPYGSTTEEESYPWHSLPKRGQDDGKLAIRITNAPPSVAEEDRGSYSRALRSDPDANVKLESLVLADDGTSLRGCIVVKNLAYDKRVAARFTFDWWQTTSEVVGRYVEGVSPSPPISMLHPGQPPAPTHDRFTFVIKLSDIMTKIEEKTMFLAIRYNVCGQEFWDNNCTNNFQVGFEKVKAERAGSPTKESGPSSTSAALKRDWSPVKESDDQMSELRKELAKVVKRDEEFNKPLQLRKERDGRKLKTIHVPLPSSNVSSPSLSPLPANEPPPMPTLSSPLGRRYDLSAALKNPRAFESTWNPPPLPPSEIYFHSARSHKKVSNTSVIPFPQTKSAVLEHKAAPVPHQRFASLGSPREPNVFDMMGRDVARERADSGAGYFQGWTDMINGLPNPLDDDVPSPTKLSPLSSQIQLPSDDEVGNDYDSPNSFGFRPPSKFGMSSSASSEMRPSSSGRFNSFPPVSSHSVPATFAAPLPRPARHSVGSLVDNLMSLEDSVESTPSVTSASSLSSPSTSSPTSPSGDLDMGDMLRMHASGEGSMDPTDYKFFLNRFCFFTGDLDADQPRRIHSESDVDTFFRNVRNSWSGSGHATPTGASSPVIKAPVGESLTPRSSTPVNDMLMTVLASVETTPKV